MNSGLNDKSSTESNVVDMSSSAISSRLREVSELHQLGLSLAKAKPMASAVQSSQAVVANTPEAVNDQAVLIDPQRDEEP